MQKIMENKLVYLPPSTHVVELTALNALMQASTSAALLFDYGNAITTEWI